MKKFFGSITLAAFVALAAGCCGDANAATEPKLSVNTVAEAGFDKLSAEQQAQIVQSITAAQSKETDVVDKVDKWVNVGERIGKMVGGAAKEIGVAANEFVQTDVGKMTAMLIVWNYMGSDVVNIFVHVVGGMMFIVIGLPTVFFIMRRSRDTVVTYSDTKTNLLGNPVVEKVERDALSGEQQFSFMVAAGLVLALGSIMMLTAL